MAAHARKIEDGPLMYKMRKYKDDHDKIMDFLARMYLNNKYQRCWLPARWNYAHYLVNPLYVERGFADWKSKIIIWEKDGDIAGVLNAAGNKNIFIHIRQGLTELQREMLEYAEEHFDDDPGTPLSVWSNAGDAVRERLLRAKGYVRGETCNFMNHQGLDGDYRPAAPPGYSIRTMEDGIDITDRYLALHRSFHPGDTITHTVPDSYYSMMSSPMYRRDLDIVAVGKDGEVVASAIAWYDKRCKTGMFEPVGTLAEHQRKGLGRAVLLEGLRRLKMAGAGKAFVESFGEERLAFYRSAGFRPHDMDYPWKKEAPMSALKAGDTC